MRVGSKWGWLSCVAVVGGWAEDGGGAVQEWVKEKEYRLQCRCGRSVVVQAKEFKGKNGMRSCGLEGCTAPGVGVGVGVGGNQTVHPAHLVEPTAPAAEGVASMGEGVASMGQTTPPPVPTPPVSPPFTRLGRPPKYHSRAAVTNFYLPMDLVGWLKREAEGQGKSASQFVAELLEGARGQARQ